jgi:hypothetical protein
MYYETRSSPIKEPICITENPAIIVDNQVFVMDDSKSELNESKPNLMEVSPGAATASEIFRHLQATHGKEEITTELAKILSVLHTTLKEEEDSSGSSSNSGSDSESRSSTDDEPEPKTEMPKTSQPAKPNSAVNSKKPTQQASAPLGKPPKYPSFQTRTLGPDIEERIRELSAPKQGRSGKEEMQILSKILVTLLCSCRSTAATVELKKIIRHFKEAASEAGDEFGTDDVDIRSSNGSSNGRSKRKKSRRRRRRWSSGATSSHSSHGSETNTLTPCNTDSKSSGTDDDVPAAAATQNSGKGTADPLVSARLRFNVVVENPPVIANGGGGTVEPETNVSFTISLPRRSSIEMSTEASYNSCNNFHSISQVEETNKEEFYDEEEEEEEEEWEWEEDDDTGEMINY